MRSVGFLDGAATTKETAQGYAMVADGLAGGTFKELIAWMKINEAHGTAMDYISHPKFDDVPQRFVRYTYRVGAENRVVAIQSSFLFNTDSVYHLSYVRSSLEQAL